jgi:hypothetical protein
VSVKTGEKRIRSEAGVREADSENESRDKKKKKIKKKFNKA